MLRVLPRDTHGLYPLHYAAMGGFIAALNWLMSKPSPDDDSAAASTAGADAWLSVTDNIGRNPVHVAAMCGRVAAVQFFASVRERLPLCSAKDKQGRTPLHYATLPGSEESVGVVEALLSAQVPVDARDDSGRTPLALARDIGNVDVIARLTACVSPPPQLLVTGVAVSAPGSLRVSWTVPQPVFKCVPPVVGFQFHFARHVRGMPLPSGPSIAPSDVRVDVSLSQATADGAGGFSVVLPVPASAPGASEGTSLLRLRCCSRTGWGAFCPFVPLPQ